MATSRTLEQHRQSPEDIEKLAPPVVVGVDGSAAALAAVDWAAAEARRRGTSLHLLCGAPRPPAVARHGIHPNLLEKWIRTKAENALDGAEVRATQIDATLPVVRSLSSEPGTVALLRAARHAGLVVLGASGWGQAIGALFGSTGALVAANAGCPVVIIHAADISDSQAATEAAQGLPPRTERPIIVGIDTHLDALPPGGLASVDFAFETAERALVPVRIIQAWHPDWTELAGGRLPAGFTQKQLDTDAAEQLDERIQPIVRRHPAVPYRIEIRHDRPAHALNAASESARLVVVAPRGAHGLTGIRIGSVSRAVIQNADCPVAVVNDAGTESARAHSAFTESATAASTVANSADSANSAGSTEAEASHGSSTS